jgi:heme exporter protein D
MKFFAMGGYAFYVWGSYAAALAVFAWNVLAPRLRRREIVAQARGEGPRP